MLSERRAPAPLRPVSVLHHDGRDDDNRPRKEPPRSDRGPRACPRRSAQHVAHGGDAVPRMPATVPPRWRAYLFPPAAANDTTAAAMYPTPAWPTRTVKHARLTT